MIQDALRRLKVGSWFSGPSQKQGAEPGSPYFSTSELGLVRRQLQASSDKAAEIAKDHGVRLHPRLAALNAREQAL